ncbi:MAG: Copper binding protein, plastocyanin/azurin family [Deltaproteobacteria bacterium]|nr:Copper binding protein, plastocyanin/azurin family [Deltaproteobacteria bacterium]
MLGRISLVMLLAVAACGGGDPAPAGVDAPAGGVDAPAAVATVTEVTPCTGETITVETTGGFRFSPKDSTITVNQIVKFVNDPTHDVAPSGSMTDSGLRVGFGATKCLKFTKAGTFNFKCTPHGFTGSITVN